MSSPTHPIPLALLFLALAIEPAGAGMEIEQYLPPVESNLTDEQRQHQQKAVERQFEEARQRAEEQALREEEALRQQQADLAARPYPVRLTETRCLGCHGLDPLTDRLRTRLGWEIVSLRMQWFNGTRLEPGERAVIAAHLAATYPAPPHRRIGEMLALAGLIVAPGFVLWWLRRRRSTSR